MKKLTLVLLVLVLMGCISLVGEAITIKMAHIQGEAHPHHLAALKFKEEVEAKTEGRVIVEIYPNGQLGGELDTAEGVKLGTLQISITGVGGMSRFGMPELQAFNVPFLIKDYKHLNNLWGGEIGAQINQKFREEQGFEILTWWILGSRVITNNIRPINSVSDLRGLKIRAPEIPVYIEMLKALGANPTPMAFPEVFGGLQMGIIDGQENPVALIHASRFFEVQKYLAVTHHMITASAVVTSVDFWNSLPEDVRVIIKDVMMDLTPYVAEIIMEQEGKLLEELESEGMTITYPDKTEFQNAVKEVYQKLDVEGLEDLYLQILETRN